jgi:t-SNARE complex subunit (syntaxin)
MAIKRRNRDGSIKLVTYKQDEDKQRIKRLEALLKEVTDLLASVTGYNDREIAPAESYDCYG